MVVLGGVEEEGEWRVGHSHEEEHEHKSGSDHLVDGRAFSTNLRIRKTHIFRAFLHSSVLLHVCVCFNRRLFHKDRGLSRSDGMLLTGQLTRLMILAADTSGELSSRIKRVPIKKSPIPFRRPSYCNHDGDIVLKKGEAIQVPYGSNTSLSMSLATPTTSIWQ